MVVLGYNTVAFIGIISRPYALDGFLFAIMKVLNKGMSMKPMKDLVIIELNEAEKEKKTEGGLFIAPPLWAKPENIGKVIAVGPDVTTLEVGEYYQINRYAAQDTEEKMIKLLREKDFLCHITQTKK